MGRPGPGLSTQFTDGKFVLVDTTRYGRVVVRESLVTRIGYTGTDFTQNIIRFVSEERLTQTIETPAGDLRDQRHADRSRHDQEQEQGRLTPDLALGP